MVKTWIKPILLGWVSSGGWVSLSNGLGLWPGGSKSNTIRSEDLKDLSNNMIAFGIGKTECIQWSKGFGDVGAELIDYSREVNYDKLKSKFFFCDVLKKVVPKRRFDKLGCRKYFLQPLGTVDGLTLERHQENLKEVLGKFRPIFKEFMNPLKKKMKDAIKAAMREKKLPNGATREGASKPLVLIDVQFIPFWFFVSQAFTAQELPMKIFSSNPDFQKHYWGVVSLIANKESNILLYDNQIRQKLELLVVPSAHMPKKKYVGYKPNTAAEALWKYDTSLSSRWSQSRKDRLFQFIEPTKFVDTFNNYKGPDLKPTEKEKEKVKKVMEFVGPTRKLVYMALGSHGKVSADGLRWIASDLKKLDRSKFAVVLRLTLNKTPSSKLNAEIEKWKNSENGAKIWFINDFFPQEALLASSLASENRLIYIQHGGASSTSEGFRYDLPMLVTPLAVDQPCTAKEIADGQMGLNLDKLIRMYRRHKYIVVPWYGAKRSTKEGKLDGKELSGFVNLFVSKQAHFKSKILAFKKEFEKNDARVTFETLVGEFIDQRKRNKA